MCDLLLPKGASNTCGHLACVSVCVLMSGGTSGVFFFPNLFSIVCKVETDSGSSGS